MSEHNEHKVPTHDELMAEIHRYASARDGAEARREKVSRALRGLGQLARLGMSPRAAALTAIVGVLAIGAERIGAEAKQEGKTHGRDARFIETIDRSVEAGGAKGVLFAKPLQVAGHINLGVLEAAARVGSALNQDAVGPDSAAAERAMHLANLYQRVADAEMEEGSLTIAFLYRQLSDIEKARGWAYRATTIEGLESVTEMFPIYGTDQADVDTARKQILDWLKEPAEEIEREIAALRKSGPEQKEESSSLRRVHGR